MLFLNNNAIVFNIFISSEAGQQNYVSQFSLITSNLSIKQPAFDESSLHHQTPAKDLMSNKQFGTQQAPSLQDAEPIRTPKQSRRSSATSSQLWVSKPPTDAVASLPSWHPSKQVPQAGAPSKQNPDIITLNPTKGLQCISFVVDNTEHNIVPWSPKDTEDQEETNQEDELDMDQDFYKIDARDNPGRDFAPMVVDESPKRDSSPVVAPPLVPKFKEHEARNIFTGPSSHQHDSTTDHINLPSPPVPTHLPTSTLRPQPRAQIKQEVKREPKLEPLPEPIYQRPLYPTQERAQRTVRKWRKQLRAICILVPKEEVDESVLRNVAEEIRRICQNIIRAMNDGSELTPDMMYAQPDADEENSASVASWLGQLCASDFARDWDLDETLQSIICDCLVWRKAVKGMKESG
ncbi:hypothetical protein BDV98DRAFT_560364 [Pterulicium gracile]|uniref:Uncharacterized protein n=1 Tax=Pterulicium gracile TaxID=1884261 RepID=A0A5C3QUL9_9AGAR|nr:hypothetical protein BDV98DRAFT_560364 [Pterula gracilis]